MNNFFDDRDTKIKKAPSCCARREGSENVPFDLERSISKNDLRSGQVKVRSLPKYVNMHIFRSVLTRKAVWHHLRVSSSILSRVIRENSW